MVLEALSSLGDRVTLPLANGALYVYLRVNRPLDAFALSRRLIVDHRVAVIPGSALASRHQIPPVSSTMKFAGCMMPRRVSHQPPIRTASSWVAP